MKIIYANIKTEFLVYADSDLSRDWPWLCNVSNSNYLAKEDDYRTTLNN